LFLLSLELPLPLLPLKFSLPSLEVLLHAVEIFTPGAEFVLQLAQHALFSLELLDEVLLIVQLVIELLLDGLFKVPDVGLYGLDVVHDVLLGLGFA